jgi:hypothetical protein
VSSSWLFGDPDHHYNPSRRPAGCLR